MTTSGVEATTGALLDAAAETGTKQDETEGVLGKDAFLRLLLTQLRYQDPMKPAQDQEFLAQMAQFSALEQMQNLTAAIETFSAQQTLASVWTHAVGMLGKQVTLTDAAGNEVTGVVTAVRWQDGVPHVVIGESAYPVGAVQTVKPAAA